MANHPATVISKPSERFYACNDATAPKWFRLASGKAAYYSVKETVCGANVDVRYAIVYDTDYSKLDSQENALKVRNRALRKIKQRVMTLGADRLLTLTYQQNMQDLAQAKKDLRQFYKTVKKKYPLWKFVGVAEYQDRGAIHWHLAVKGFQDVRYLRQCWLSCTGGPGSGNIDVTPPRKGRLAEICAKLAEYISKYLGKGFEIDDKPRYSHYYVTSRGLVAETQSYHVYGYDHHDIEEFVRGLLANRGVKVRTKWWVDDHKERGGGRSW